MNLKVGQSLATDAHAHVAAERGFTLIELIITLAIMAVLALLVLPVAEVSIQRSKEQELRLALREIRTAIDAYKTAVDEGRILPQLNNSPYPKTLKQLVEGMEDMRSPKRSKIYFLRRIPRDPMHPDSRADNIDTWGLRSYASPPDAPQEGEDIFDVYSKTTTPGLNGQPYNQW